MTEQDRTWRVVYLFCSTQPMKGPFWEGLFPAAETLGHMTIRCSLCRSEYGDFRHRNIMPIQNKWHYIGIKNILYDNKVILPVASNPELYVRHWCFVESVLLFGLVFCVEILCLFYWSSPCILCWPMFSVSLACILCWPMFSVSLDCAFLIVSCVDQCSQFLWIVLSWLYLVLTNVLSVSGLYLVLTNVLSVSGLYLVLTNVLSVSGLYLVLTNVLSVSGLYLVLTNVLSFSGLCFLDCILCWPMFSVSLDCAFLIATSVSSSFYFSNLEQQYKFSSFTVLTIDTHYWSANDSQVIHDVCH
jgi:hypothetical protein